MRKKRPFESEHHDTPKHPVPGLRAREEMNIAGRLWPTRRYRGPLDEAAVQHKWLRLYRPGPLRVVLIIIFLTASVFVAVLAAGLVLAAPNITTFIATMLVVLGVAGGLLWLTAQLLTAGVYVTDAGLRILPVWGRARTYAWDHIVQLACAPSSVRLWGVGPRITGQALTLELRPGLQPPSQSTVTVLSSASLDLWLRPETFDIQTAALQDWWARATT